MSQSTVFYSLASLCFLNIFSGVLEIINLNLLFNLYLRAKLQGTFSAGDLRTMTEWEVVENFTSEKLKAHQFQIFGEIWLYQQLEKQNNLRVKSLKYQSQTLRIRKNNVYLGLGGWALGFSGSKSKSFYICSKDKWILFEAAIWKGHKSFCLRCFLFSPPCFYTVQSLVQKSTVTQCPFTSCKYFCYDRNIILEDGTMVLLLF